MDKDQHTQSLWVKYLSAFIALELLEKIKKNKRTFGKLSQLVVSEFQFVASNPYSLGFTVQLINSVLQMILPTLRLSGYINRKNTRDDKGLFKK